MFTKNVKGVIIPRHDTAENWARATNFTPSKGEFIIYDADSPERNYNTVVIIDDVSYEVVSSPTVRLKIGDGVHNVNALEFIKTGVTEQWIKDYIDNRTDISGLVYLNTRETVGQNIELQDVFPVQSDEIKLEVISKNILPTNTTTTDVEGVTVSVNSSTVSVSGKATAKIKTDVDLAEVYFKCPGKYVFSTSSMGLGFGDDTTATKKCYLVYTLFDDKGDSICNSQKVVTTNTYIDTRELNCSKILVRLRLDVPSGATFENSNELEFRLQLEYGDAPSEYSDIAMGIDLENVKVNIFGRNLYNPDWVYDESLQNVTTLPMLALDDSIIINGNVVGTIKPYTKCYFKGVMTEDTYITYKTSSNSTAVKLRTPLKKGDKFTLIYMVNLVADSVPVIQQPQLVYGHTDYEEYYDFEMSTVQSGQGGVCTVTKLNYPYTFINIDESEPNRDNLSVYVQYDPALSRNWTEKELDRLKSLIGTGGVSAPVKGVDYWTAEDKQEIVDSVLSGLELSADGIKLNDAVTEDTYTLYVADGKLTLRKESDQ